MAAFDSESVDDLMFLAVLLTGTVIAVNWWRNRQAGLVDSSSGFYFAPAPPPPPSFGGDVLNILAPRQLSPAGAAFIKGKETLSLTAYPDAGGRAIGWGHKIQPGESFPPRITMATAQSLFDGDAATAEAAVNSGLQVEVDQNQFDALVDFAFNEGAGAFARSTLLRLINAGDFAGAAAQLNRWIYSQGTVNKGLQNRRSAEIHLFNS